MTNDQIPNVKNYAAPLTSAIIKELQSRGITYGLKLSLERLDDKGIDAVAAFGEYVFDIKDLDSYDEINGVAYHSVSVKLADLINSVLDDLKDQGTLEKLFTKHPQSINPV